MIFEISVLILVSVFILILYKLDTKVIRRFWISFVAVLIFEYFTQALWINRNLEPWSYLYLDVNWILTIGWAGIITVCMQVIDLYFPQLKEKVRYVLSVLFIGIVGFFAEWVVVGMSIRHYPEAVKSVLSGITLGDAMVPIEALYYIPVFMALMVSFVRYWEINFDEKIKVIKSRKSKRGKKK